MLLFPDESSHLSWENLQPSVILYSWGNKGPGGQACLCPFALPESQSLQGGAVLLRLLFSTWKPLDIWEKDIQRTFCYLLKKQKQKQKQVLATFQDWTPVSMTEWQYPCGKQFTPPWKKGSLPHTASWRFPDMLKTEVGKGFVCVFFPVQCIQICYPKCPGKGQWSHILRFTMEMAYQQGKQAWPQGFRQSLTQKKHSPEFRHVTSHWNLQSTLLKNLARCL